MIERRFVQLGAVTWAAVGLAVGIAEMARVNEDARALFLAAAIVGPASALLASDLLRRGHDRAAGALLVVSVVTPTVFAWVLNVPALVVGIALLLNPTWITRRQVLRR